MKVIGDIVLILFGVFLVCGLVLAILTGITDRFGK